MAGLFALSLLSACGLETTIDGDVAGFDIPAVGTMEWGGKYIFFSDEELGCADLWWVHHTYSSGLDPTDGLVDDMVGIQFTFLDDDDAFAGNFSVAADAPVSAKVLMLEGGAFDQSRGRSGTFVIDELESDGVASGTFDVTFDDGTFSGTWEADFCVNLPD